MKKPSGSELIFGMTPFNRGQLGTAKFVFENAD
jgi:hypothetical protein